MLSSGLRVQKFPLAPVWRMGQKTQGPGRTVAPKMGVEGTEQHFELQPGVGQGDEGARGNL